MVNDFFPKAEVGASILFWIDPTDEDHQAHAMSFLHRLFALVEETNSRLGEIVKVVINQERRVRLGEKGPVRLRKKAMMPQMEKVLKSKDPKVTIAALDRHDWDKDKAAAELGIKAPAIYSRLQDYERRGLLKRNDGKGWRNAERRF